MNPDNSNSTAKPSRNMVEATLFKIMNKCLTVYKCRFFLNFNCNWRWKIYYLGKQLMLK